MPVNRKAVPRAEREALILDRAAEMFRDAGFHETAVSELARACGLTANAVTYYFPSKDMILAAVLERWTSAVLEEVGLAEAAGATRADGSPTTVAERFDMLEAAVGSLDPATGRPGSLAVLIERLRPYRRVYAVVHERMHAASCVARWHRLSHLLFGTLITADVERRFGTAPAAGPLAVAVALVENGLLHEQEGTMSAAELIENVLDQVHLLHDCRAAG
ncbi:TetR/AcrR family transcriptional regulator [Streptomyces griseoaurantiacus]|uniref:helix-turn-helix domain-containing protein n=1 Tax=Streptomyces griseoaurantiacus TaxID=68213 RepID=UPI00352CA016